MVGAYIARRLRKVEGAYGADGSKGVGPYGRAALERWRGHTPVGTFHDVTAQKVGRIPPVGTTRHVPINYRGVVKFLWLRCRSSAAAEAWTVECSSYG